MGSASSPSAREGFGDPSAISPAEVRHPRYCVANGISRKWILLISIYGGIVINTVRHVPMSRELTIDVSQLAARLGGGIRDKIYICNKVELHQSAEGEDSRL